VPAVSPPDPGIAGQIASLAQQPYALDRWHAPARALGTRLGAKALPSLLGVMAHPPAPPAGWRVWDWLLAVQLASALTLAHIDEGWDGSLRQTALMSLVYGPMDWSGAAALMALAVLARQDMRIHIAYDRLCLDLWEQQPDQPWALEEALVMSLLFVESYSEAAAAKIKGYFDRQRHVSGDEG
jgi:hypothetical protein